MSTRIHPCIILFVGLALLPFGLAWAEVGFGFEVVPVVYYLLSVVLVSAGLVGICWRPIQRREQTRFFLYLLAQAEESGQSIEQIIISLSKGGEQPLGPQFDRVARHIESGLNLPEALAREPGCLPAQVVAIYKVGHETGDVSMVLPVAQENHRENGESVFSGLIYHVIVLSIAVMIVGILMTYVIPKFKAIFADMLEPGEVLPEFTMLVLKISDTIKNNAAALFIPLLLLFGVWFYCEKKGWLDMFWLLIPWHRKRLQRDYSRVLALLLDSGMPEEKAIELAAQSTSNRTIKKRARKVIAGLQSGMNLTEAIKLMDDSREFQWRLTNALQTDGKFVDSLSGWHQSLSARADRQHRSFASLIEATMILLLGLIIGSIMIGMFLPLIKLMDKLTY
jgi:type IV pilus assembly protein PilC